jgi:hypothetical protein
LPSLHVRKVGYTLCYTLFIETEPYGE